MDLSKNEKGPGGEARALQAPVPLRRGEEPRNEIGSDLGRHARVLHGVDPRLDAALERLEGWLL